MMQKRRWFPAWAKPRHPLAISFDASAGEARSEKIMLKQQAKAKYQIDLKSFRFRLRPQCDSYGMPPSQFAR
jgi:hypothetical protein